MHQIELIIQRIEHTLKNADESRSADALRNCLEDIYRIAAGTPFRNPTIREGRKTT